MVTGNTQLPRNEYIISVSIFYNVLVYVLVYYNLLKTKNNSVRKNYVNFGSCNYINIHKKEKILYSLRSYRIIQRIFVCTRYNNNYNNFIIFYIDVCESPLIEIKLSDSAYNKIVKLLIIKNKYLSYIIISQIGHCFLYLKCNVAKPCELRCNRHDRRTVMYNNNWDD